MFKLLATVTVLLAIYAQGVPAAYCYGRSFGFSSDWTCTFSCCYDFSLCCYNYWYAWTLASVFFLICLCSCAGFGGYRYRRRYYYTQTNAPVATTVVTANTTSYQPAPPPQGAYQPYAPPKDAPPPYNPAAGQKPPPY